VDGQVDQPCVGVASRISAIEVLPACELSLSAIWTRGERGVGLDAHDLVDQPGERDHRGGLLDTVEQTGVVDVSGGQVGRRAAAQVVELRPSRGGPAREPPSSGGAPERL